MPGDWAIDATAGNGNDTLVLADTVGPTGIVWAFDIQRVAIEEARRRAADLGWANVRFECRCHSELSSVIAPEHAGRIAAVMFNLGYLPRGDHAVVTRLESTRRALDQAIELLRPGGVITIVAYTAHQGGIEESAGVRRWLRAVEEGSTGTVERIASEPPHDGRDREQIPWLAVVRKSGQEMRFKEKS